VNEITEYLYHDPDPTWGSQYLWPIVRQVTNSHKFHKFSALELGCGNGAASNLLSTMGFKVTGVDPSESGIRLASKFFPQCVFYRASAYDDLVGSFGRFELVLSLEVVQHCVNPRRVARALFDLVEPGGIAIVSVTYHGYLKNLALAVTGRLDAHLNALWDSGPVKFFSMRTFHKLLEEAGFDRIEFEFAGRVPWMAKSMVAICHKD